MTKTITASRRGDFYEFVGDDAITVSGELGLTVTRLNDGPLCGFPVHSAQLMRSMLIDRGYNIKGLVDPIAELLKSHGFNLAIEDYENGRQTYWTRNDGSNVEVLEKHDVPPLICAKLGVNPVTKLVTIRVEDLSKLLGAPAATYGG